MNTTDAHVLAALRATGGGLDTVELAYQMRRRGRPVPEDLDGSLQRLKIAGLVTCTDVFGPAWTAVRKERAHAA